MDTGILTLTLYLPIQDGNHKISLYFLNTVVSMLSTLKKKSAELSCAENLGVEKSYRDVLRVLI
jgi:hypothetical protein